MQYPAKFTPAKEGGYIVTFRDIPEAITQGDNLTEAQEMATDALILSMDFYFETHKTIPMPSKLEHGEKYVKLPDKISKKISVFNKMINQYSQKKS